MKRLIFRLTFALLTFTIGVTSALFWLNYRKPSQPSINFQEATSSELNIASQPIKFEPKSSACGYVYVREGGRFSSHDYESSDGVGVGYSVGDYGTPARANHALLGKIKDAIQVIERMPNLNAKGKRVGERIVAMFPPNAPSKELVEVFWTDGSHFYVIDSPSLKHALEFEQSSIRWIMVGCRGIGAAEQRHALARLLNQLTYFCIRNDS